MDLHLIYSAAHLNHPSTFAIAKKLSSSRQANILFVINVQKKKKAKAKKNEACTLSRLFMTTCEWQEQ